jgi:hypothetical protein
MARGNGQLTWCTPVGSAAVLGDGSDGGEDSIFTATERVTVVEVGAICGDSTNVPSSAFSFRVLKRTGGVAANDVIQPVWKAAFAAEGGVSGDPSILNFDNANAISGGLITNTLASLTAGKCLRAFTEVSLDKADQLVFEVVGTSAGDTVVFYAKAYCNGAGIVESCDVDSN